MYCGGQFATHASSATPHDLHLRSLIKLRDDWRESIHVAQETGNHARLEAALQKWYTQVLASLEMHARYDTLGLSLPSLARFFYALRSSMLYPIHRLSRLAHEPPACSNMLRAAEISVSAKPGYHLPKASLEPLPFIKQCSISGFRVR